jgi:hypothetical protein
MTISKNPSADGRLARAPMRENGPGGRGVRFSAAKEARRLDPLARGSGLYLFWTQGLEGGSISKAQAKAMIAIIAPVRGG